MDSSNSRTTRRERDAPSSPKPTSSRDKAQDQASKQFSKMHVTPPHEKPDRETRDRLRRQQEDTVEASTSTGSSSATSQRTSSNVESSRQLRVDTISESSSMDAESVSTSTDSQMKKSPLYDNVPHSVQAFETRAKTRSRIVVAQSLPIVPNTEFGLGSVVEVLSDIVDGLFGVIKWIGVPPGYNVFVIGLELEDRMPDIPMDVTDGKYHDVRLFDCLPGRGIFLHPNQLGYDHRFDEIEVLNYCGDGSPLITGTVAPINIMNYDDLKKICGTFKGIQGHMNSCYLDATIFSMFAFTNVFDSVLYREPIDLDIAEYNEIRAVLRDEIVNPLRVNKYVKYDSIMKMRLLLDQVCSGEGLTKDEKDPEEFLNFLMIKALRAEPLLQFNNLLSTFCYQLFFEKNDKLVFPTVQQLLEHSLVAGSVRLGEVPRCLILQMPRFGTTYKMYNRIVPTQLLDVTDLMENSPRQCYICGLLAELECKDCLDTLYEETAYCKNCYKLKEQHHKKEHCKPVKLNAPEKYKLNPKLLSTVPRIYMDLFAVVCIETSHYVSFVKTGRGDNAPWCFFDSMADRRSNFNVPELLSVDDLPEWISDRGSKALNERAKNDRQLPPLAKRLLCDAYLCMYQSTDMMMYQ